MSLTWNVLTEKWLDTIAVGGQTQINSPLKLQSTPGGVPIGANWNH